MMNTNTKLTTLLALALLALMCLAGTGCNDRFSAQRKRFKAMQLRIQRQRDSHRRMMLQIQFETPRERQYRKDMEMRRLLQSGRRFR